MDLLIKMSRLLQHKKLGTTFLVLNFHHVALVRVDAAAVPAKTASGCGLCCIRCAGSQGAKSDRRLLVSVWLPGCGFQMGPAAIGQGGSSVQALREAAQRAGARGGAEAPVPEGVGGHLHAVAGALGALGMDTLKEFEVPLFMCSAHVFLSSRTAPAVHTSSGTICRGGGGGVLEQQGVRLEKAHDDWPEAGALSQQYWQTVWTLTLT